MVTTGPSSLRAESSNSHKPGYRCSAGEAIALRLTEDTISDAKNLKEFDCRSSPDRRRVVCQRDPVLRQAGIRENRGKGLRLLPCDIRQTRTERSRRLLRRTRSFAERLHARQLGPPTSGTRRFINREETTGQVWLLPFKGTYSNADGIWPFRLRLREAG